MPYTHKKIGYKHCVSTKKADVIKEQLKKTIRNIVKELLKEESSVVMRTKVENDKLENVIGKNIGVPFDPKEKQEFIFKQGTLGIKSVIQNNGTEIKFSISDMFGNNKINVIKKLQNKSDTGTFVYANFFSVVPVEQNPEETPQPNQNPADKPDQGPTENKTYIKLSQPFEDNSSEKLDILGDFIQQLEIK